MLPRWLRALVAVEVCGLVAVAVVGARLVSGGVQATGRVLSWGPPPLATAPPGPGTWRAPAPAANATRPGLLAVPGLLDRLDRDTGVTAAGELALVQQLEAVIRDRVVRLLDGQTRR